MGLFDVDGPLAVAVRWGLLSSLTATIGATVMHDVAVNASADVEIATRLRSVMRAGGIAMLGMALVRAGLQLLSVAGSVGDLAWADVGPIITGTTWGKAWIAQVVAAAALTALADSPPDSASRAVRGLLTVALALSAAFSGHAAAVEFGGPAVIAADTLHVLAAGVWIGGLGALLFAGWTRAGGDAFHRIRRRFSTLALASASVLALTGITAAGSQGVTFSNLVTDHYAITMLRKLVAVAVVLALGGWNWKLTRDAAARSDVPPRFAGIARSEVLMGLVVLLLTAVLVATATPGEG